MKRTASFRRKRPLILPPLSDLQPSKFHSMGTLQPFNLLLAENRMGSPAPRRNISVIPIDIEAPTNGRPIIEILEPSSEEIEVPNTAEQNIQFLAKKINSFNKRELESKTYDAENTYVKDHSRKHSECLQDNLSHKLKSQRSIPLEEPENLKNVQSKNLWISTRYTLLKPIGQDKIEDGKYYT